MPYASIQWERQIGRRLRLRDLFVFFTVVRSGSMAKAAAQLNVSPPSVSEIIADLEQALGVRLLDRSPQGVMTTLYGDALLKRGEAAFDESTRARPVSATPTSSDGASANRSKRKKGGPFWMPIRGPDRMPIDTFRPSVTSFRSLYP
jgi:hypothetical protein